MYRKFVNARSPLRLLEKGLHGGLGVGNVGVLLAGNGVGKSSFLIGVAIDELLRGGTVLHIALDHPLDHVRDYYDVVYGALAESTHLDDVASTQSEIETRRRIRVYKQADFNASKLAEAVKIESEAGGRPTLIVIDGLDASGLQHDDLAGIRALAQELAAEVWMTLPADQEHNKGLPSAAGDVEDLVSVILAMEPEGKEIKLLALKDHENEDLHNLHVALDPKTLLLIRD